MMHETSHQLGLPDHYCYGKDSNDPESKCINEYCDECVFERGEARQCLMSYRYDVENTSEATLYCSSCLASINAHLTDHHQ